MTHKRQMLMNKIAREINAEAKEKAEPKALGTFILLKKIINIKAAICKSKATIIRMNGMMIWLLAINTSIKVMVLPWKK